MTDSQVEAQAENNAEGVQKLTDTKAIIAYLVEKFPLCFIAEGEAKPLKIGLFQDLAEALKDDEHVSKTQLRQALRQYTSNWRYLHGCREGAERVDLYGNPAGVLDAEHVSHAAQQLAEAKAKFGFFLDAFKYGAPPHGGLAFGIDRWLMVMLKEESIRDVIPFPKTNKGQCLMTEAPNTVDEKQLEELFIKSTYEK